MIKEKNIFIELNDSELMTLEESLLYKLRYYNEIILSENGFKEDYIKYVKSESNQHQEILLKLQLILNKANN